MLYGPVLKLEKRGTVSYRWCQK